MFEVMTFKLRGAECKESSSVHRALNKQGAREEIQGARKGVPERGDAAGFEALAEQVDGLCSVGTLSIEVDAAEFVAIEAARPHRSEGVDGVKVFSGR